MHNKQIAILFVTFTATSFLLGFVRGIIEELNVKE